VNVEQRSGTIGRLGRTAPPVHFAGGERFGPASAPIRRRGPRGGRPWLPIAFELWKTSQSGATGGDSVSLNAPNSVQNYPAGPALRCYPLLAKRIARRRNRRRKIYAANSRGAHTLEVRL